MDNVVLDLGCGDNKRGGIGLDKIRFKGVDILCDLNKGIPLKNSSVDRVVAFHCIEHLDNFFFIMSEICRVLKVGGIVEVVVPHVSSLNAFADPSHCYSEDTEVLTKRGWMLFKDVLENDEVVTINKITLKIEYQKLLSKMSYRYNGKMIHLFDRNFIDLLITPEHMIVVKSNYGYREKLMLKRACDLINYKYTRIPLTGVWIGQHKAFFELPPVIDFRGQHNKGYLRKPLKIPMSSWLAFLGIWLAEGDIYRNDKKNRYQVRVSQYNEKIRGKMRELFETFPIHFKEYKTGWISANKQLVYYLERFGHAEDKFIPEDIKQLPKEELRILYEWMMHGDGSTRTRKASFGFVVESIYTTTSKKLADDFCELLLRIGQYGRIVKLSPSVGKIGNKSFKRKEQYRVICKKGGKNEKEPLSKLKYRVLQNMDFVDYDGNVYCVSVPNETLYVKRNGYPIWCGNCNFFTFRTFDFLDSNSLRVVKRELKTKSRVVSFVFNLRPYYFEKSLSYHDEAEIAVAMEKNDDKRTIG